MTTDAQTWLGEDSEAALTWEKEQAGAASEYARALPGFEDLVAELTPVWANQLAGAVAERTLVAGRWFWLGTGADGTGQAVRVAEDRDSPGAVLLDAAALTAERGDGRPTALLYPVPSPDGALVAVSAAAGGAPFGEVRVVEVATGRLLPLAVPAMLGNMVRPVWAPDGSGFHLAGRTAEGAHELRFHRLSGETAASPLPGVPPTALTVLPQVSPGGTRVLTVTGPHEHLAVLVGDTATGEFRPFAPEGFAGELYGDWLDEDTYVAISTDTPRGRVVRIPVATSTDTSTWQELLAPGELVLRGLYRFGDRLVLTALRDVGLEVRVHGLDGAPLAIAALPPASGSSQLTVFGRLPGPSSAFTFTAGGFTREDSTYQLHPATGGLEVLHAGAELPGLAVDQHFAVSADGTRVPYYVIARADLDRSRPLPTLVSAYGGFNIPKLPGHLGAALPFVRSGGVYVHANPRGGSEYGRDWYLAARRATKQRTFDDLRAVAEDLVRRGIATPGTLAFQGSSNGGLLAGVAITQQPDLWRVCVPTMPVLDLLAPLADGPAAAMIRSVYDQDYGDPADPADAPVLAAYSPYQNIRPGTAYPAVFVVVGAGDVSCPPPQARRFAAALRAASTSGHPVLLRVWDEVGHGSLDPAVAARMTAEWLAFVLRELDLPLVPA
ncbi:prolyl oligopeptidase [Crossiella equi]|uniref:Prolyl oligopeptidase n=1 Tax=Crossiella equi TaxID=130796 RepID=A0ABS5ACQ4_9PSEU|nr:prolyl oligopeptidase family serine peptidase [Crossiella equi]MBP2474368.1 prolyl oligopeptidase [Crossiella equi]